MPYPSKTDRETILARALEQLRRQGLRGLSWRSLAVSLGLTPNALYRYFADRAALEAALTGEVSRLLLADMRQTVGDDEPWQAIWSIAQAYLGFARNQPKLYELLLLPCGDEGEGAAHHEELWQFVIKHVGMLSGPRCASEASLALWAYLHGIAQLDAMRVFDSGKPGKELEFGLNAWLTAAAKADEP